ncbi:unnamed protein product [Closterium sp. Yama58-4]|nr:unnamed protein product [Closterium sp. Yama58-4]
MYLVEVEVEVEAVGAAGGVAVVGVVAGLGWSVAAAGVVAAVVLEEAGMEVVVVAAVGVVAAARVVVGVDQRSVEARVVPSIGSSVLERPRHPSSFVGGTLSMGGLGVEVPARMSSAQVAALVEVPARMSFAQVTALVRHVGGSTRRPLLLPPQRAWRAQFPEASELPRWADLLKKNIDVFALDFDVILGAMYALTIGVEGDCYLCVPPDPGIATSEAAALGASASAAPGPREAAALGAGVSAAPGACETAPSGTASTAALHTFTLDSGASRCFFRDRTALEQLPRPVAVSLADPSGGPVLATSSTVLPCPADGGVHQFTPAYERVTHCTCARTGRHLATFTRQPGSDLYTLTTESPQVAASASASGQLSAPCSCRSLSHQTVLWHHRLGHPSVQRLRGMHRRLLVSGLPRVLPPLPPSPAPPCLPCVEGRQRATPHSSEFPPTKAPPQTLHMHVWGPAHVHGQGGERYFLLVVDDYTRYTTVFPLRTKGEVPDVLIPWIRATRLQLERRFRSDLPVLRLHSDRGGEFSSDLLRAFCQREGIKQKFTLPASPQQNGVAERRIGLVMEIARTSLVHAAAPHFLWPFAVRYAAHQLNLWPRVSAPETSPTLRWTGEVGDASVFRVWGSRAFVRDASADKLSSRTLPCVFLGFVSDAPGWQFYHPTSRRVFPSQDVTFDESVPFYRLFPYRTAPLPPPPLFLTPDVASVDPLPPQGPAPSGVSQVDPVEPVEVAVDSGPARGTEPERAEPGGAGSGGTETGGAEPGGAETGGAEPGGAEPGVLALLELVVLQELELPLGVLVLLVLVALRNLDFLTLPLSTGLPLQPGSPLPAPSPYTEQTGGLTERREPASRPASPVRTARTSRRVPRPRPPPVPGTHQMALRPSTAPQRVPPPFPPPSSLADGPDPESDSLRAASPTVTRLLATVVTDPSFESAAASALVAELVDFAAHCRLDYAASLVAESESVCPPSVGGECALGTDVLEDRQEEFECFAAAVPHLVSMLIAPEGDPDAPDIPTPRSYAEAIAGSPPVFKARYVARGFSQREGVDFFQAFSPTPKMTTLWVLLHVAAQRDYELHSLDFSTAFLQGSLHEEIWLRRPSDFTGSFPPGTQWSLRRPVYGLRQAPREWHDTLRTTLAALGFAPSTADPSLFLRTDTSLPPFYILVYVDDLVFATADTEALAHVKSELQKRHTCTDLGELRSYLGLQITRDRARRTITLTQSHMVQQVLQRFSFTWSSAQATPLATGHSLSAPPSDESVEPSGPYPELVGCLMYLMTCTRPDLAYPLGLLARYVAPGRHRPEHMAAAKRVLRYLCSTSGMGLVLGGNSPIVLTGHSDASWVDDQATQRSSQGYTFSLGSGSVSWRSTCSSSVLSSSCEAEIYATAMAAQELHWLTYLLTDLGEQPRSPPVLYVDNKAAIALCEEHRLEHRTKHIALRYFLARELQQRGQLRLRHVATRVNTADIFTKALQPGDHQRFCTMLGLVPTFPHLL